ncbi:MAG: hypothetical protein ACI9UA_000599 [Pseudoalteromonas tetraodonis]|jgi:hypothetical protein
MESATDRNMRTLENKFYIFILAGLLSAGHAVGHPGHDHGASSADHNKVPFVVSNWGSLLYRSATEYTLPVDEGLKKHLGKNHGGTVVDPTTGNLYTTIGAKLIRFRPSPSSGVIMEDAERFGVGNFHGLALKSGGAEPSFYFADNERHLVRFHSYGDGLTTDHFPVKSIDPYFTKGGSFNPTDVEIHPESGNPWSFDGYGSSLVMDLFDKEKFFGGKSVFNTAHGGAFYRGNWVVCSRGSGEICTVNSDGKVVDRFLISKGNMPCDIDFFGDFALVGCLRGPGTKDGNYPGAPCYVYHWPSKQLVSTLVPKSDFGFKLGTHIHNAAWWPQIVDGKVTKLFIAFSFWNPGDFRLVEVAGLPLGWAKIGLNQAEPGGEG